MSKKVKIIIVVGLLAIATLAIGILCLNQKPEKLGGAELRSENVTMDIL